MSFSLNKKQIIISGIGIIFLIPFLIRLSFLLGTSVTNGECIRLYSWGRKTRYTAPEINFITLDSNFEITFYGETNLTIDNPEKVPVIYKTKNPTDAYVYSMMGFWLPPFLYCIIPLFLFCAASLAFLDNDKNYQFILPSWKTNNETNPESKHIKIDSDKSRKDINET